MKPENILNTKVTAEDYELSIGITVEDVASVLNSGMSARRMLNFAHPCLFIDLFSGAQPLHTITKPPRAWVHHYGNSQVLVKYWNKWMPAKCISQRCHFHRAGFFRFVHRKLYSIILEQDES